MPLTGNTHIPKSRLLRALNLISCMSSQIVVYSYNTSDESDICTTMCTSPLVPDASNNCGKLLNEAC